MLIGINNYNSSEFLPLRGAEPDTLQFKSYLTDRLKVPESQIVVLLNENATRKRIVKSLESMASDKRIFKGDPILIFYAGHGGETPVKDSTGEYKIQMLIPFDFNVDESNKVPGIPDLTIGSLIDKIAEKKGDNIVGTFLTFEECNCILTYDRPSFSIAATLHLEQEATATHAHAQWNFPLAPLSLVSTKRSVILVPVALDRLPSFDTPV